MIYAQSGRLEQKTFCADDFSGGVDLQNGREIIADGCLFNSCNIWQRSGRIESRPGILCESGGVLAQNDGGEVEYDDGGDFYFDEYGIKTVLMRQKYSDKTVLSAVKISSDKTVGTVVIHTYNHADYTGEVGELKCVMFSDKPKKGCGIYALVSVVRNKTILDRFVYEMSANMDRFIKIDKSEIYAPTVYVNGKGNKFNTLEKTDRNYPSPSALEEPNLLCGAFIATYKTDGVSDTFVLPYRNIGNSTGEKINIKFTDSTGLAFDFIIAPESVMSGEVTIGGEAVKAGINRINGRVSFFKGSSAYALPYVDGAYNNLSVKAYREADDRLFFMKGSDSYNAHTFLYGGENPNEMYYSSTKAALYFPSGNCVNVGDSFQSVTMTAKQNNLLVLFKSHEIYYISGVKQADYDISELIRGNVRSASVKSTVSVNQLNGSVGCIYPKTVRLCQNRLVFLGSDGCVYSLTSTAMSQKQVYMISKAVNVDMSAMNRENCFALKYDGHYLLFFGDVIMLFDYNCKAFRNISSNAAEVAPDKSVPWFIWRTSDICGSLGGIDFNEEPLIYGIYSDEVKTGGREMLIIKSFSGSFDKVAISGTVGINDIAEEKEIECDIRTRFYRIDGERTVNVDKISVCGIEKIENGRRVNVAYITDKGVFEDKSVVIKNRLYENELTLYPRLKSIRLFGIDMNISGEFSMAKIKVGYC